MIITAIGIIKDWRDLNALEIVRHPWFISAFAAGSLAQLFKMLSNWKKTRRMDFSHLFMSGGMPSAHSALVTALSVAVGLTDGFNSPIAMIAVGFGLLVLFDAATLRRAAGEHARLLNKIVERLNASDEVKIEAAHLQEMLGHRRREVLAGVVLGIATAIFVCSVWDFWK